MRTLRLLIAVTMTLTANAACGADPVPFAFLKTGEKYATQEQAGGSVEALAGYVAGQMTGSTNLFLARIFNSPSKTIEFVSSKKAVAGMVTPGFYLAYAKTLGIEPLLEAKMTGIEADRCVLVARKDTVKQLADLNGKTIATQLADEQRFVLGVLLQDKLSPETRLQRVHDPEAAIFALLEKAADSADAVLIEETTWTGLFADDKDVTAQLHIVHQSDALPGSLVVVFRPNLAEFDLDKFKAALTGMKSTDDGKPILRNIRVETFNDIDHERLDRCQKLFTGK
jgi:ABC-type phosphate/phosphonate transport system substrate-binding protein